MQKIFLAVSLTLAAGSLARADEVTAWNDMYLDTIRAAGGGPTYMSRAGAMMHAAMHDAVQAVDGQYEQYSYHGSAPAGTSREAAVIVSAHDVLTNLYPARASIYAAQRDAQLAAIPNSAGKTAGITLGSATASSILSQRASDGYNNTTPYVPGTNPGDWRPTGSGDAHAPNWGNVTPFGMTTSSQFRPPAPPALTSAAYTAAFNDVKEFGSLTSTMRTAEQTRTGFFWANDVNGTYKPPGHLNHITQEIAASHNLSLAQNARLFALANLAMADAGIAAWDSKYNTPFDLWRPVTGIQQADTDSNPLTLADPTWQPLNAFTPPFPAYISGHATFGAAHAAVMASFFGTDTMTYTITSEDPLYTGGPRTYNSFSEAALENGRSRVYLGVHWQFDADEGYTCGTHVGDWTASHELQLIPSPGTMVVLCGGVVVFGRRRRCIAPLQPRAGRDGRI